MGKWEEAHPDRCLTKVELTLAPRFLLFRTLEKATTMLLRFLRIGSSVLDQPTTACNFWWMSECR